MSFCIKPTHRLVRPTIQPPPEKINVMALLESERQTGTIFLNEHFPVDTEISRHQNQPKVGSDKGMAIRTSVMAPSDHY